jgi:PAS domain S-box-containing protein
MNDAETRFRSAAEAARIGVWEYDLVSGALFTSTQCRRNLGYPPDAEPRWEDLEHLAHPQDRARRRAALAHSIATGDEFDLEYRILRKDGAMRWLHARAQVTRDADGQKRRLAGISFDVTERRLAELRLELSEESLRLAADAAEIGTWDLDLTNNALTWSDRTFAMFGMSPDLPCSLADFYGGLHPEDYEATAAAFASALDPQTRATYYVEFRTVGKSDGRIRWIAAKGKGLFEDGRCRRAIGTAIDITARKHAGFRQSFLLEVLDRLRRHTRPGEILQTAAQALGGHLRAHLVGYGLVEPDDRTVLLDTPYTDGAEPLAGRFALEDFGARNIAAQHLGHTIVVRDVLADPTNDLPIWPATGIRAYVSVPLVRDGRLRATLFLTHRQPHDWSDGDVALIEDVAARSWDALERARAEQGLRELNASLEAQVETRTRELDRTWRLSPVLMLVGSMTGDLLAVNPAWTHTLGWTPEETLGRNVMQFVAPEDKDTGLAGMAALARGEPVVDYQNSFVSKTGQRRRIAWTTVPEDGFLYAYGRDVTDQLIAEERLRQAQKMEAVGQLTGGLSHDFNNLLTGIGGSLELLEKRVAQGRLQEIDRYIDAARGAVRRAGALTQRLLAFSRQQTLDPQPTDLNALIAEMEELIRRSMGPEMELLFVPSPDLCVTLVDGHQLENALLNLCINARDAMPGGGRVTIETAQRRFDDQEAHAYDVAAGTYLSLCVSDNGTGMSEEVRRRAFDPFYTTKPTGSGSGLGLSMTYGFARQSGGQVHIESALGRGTSVTIYLPCLAGQTHTDPPHPERREAAVPARRGAVLVVDDEADIRMLVSETLQERGHRIYQAGDAAAALALLRSAPDVDLLVTDIGLPGALNGSQLAEQARALRPRLRVLFMTGYMDKPDIGTSRIHVLPKPFQLDALSRTVRDLLAEPAPI